MNRIDLQKIANNVAMANFKNARSGRKAYLAAWDAVGRADRLAGTEHHEDGVNNTGIISDIARSAVDRAAGAHDAAKRRRRGR